MSEYQKYKAKQRADKVPFNEERASELFNEIMKDNPEDDIRVGDLSLEQRFINSIDSLVDEFVDDSVAINSALHRKIKIMEDGLKLIMKHGGEFESKIAMDFIEKAKMEQTS